MSGNPYRSRNARLRPLTHEHHRLAHVLLGELLANVGAALGQVLDRMHEVERGRGVHG
jgi:hypothetical protein